MTTKLVRCVRWLRLGFIASSLSALYPVQSVAQNLADSDTLNTSPDDYATLIIDFLFRGGTPPANFPFSTAHLLPLASALRDAMGGYSLAMLALAVFLIGYQIVGIVVETAHHGKFLGLRGNQIWGPIRLIVAFLFLIPMGNGLSGGQHLVLRIASMGSSLASHVQRNITTALSTDFITLAPPRGPDLPSFTMVSMEMELCRNSYLQGLATPLGASAARILGSMGDIQKLPATNVNPEIWRYTNTLNANAPMCGEYRFSGYRQKGPVNPASGDVIDHIADDIASFSRMSADAALAQSRMTAGTMGIAFSAGDTSAPGPILSSATTLRQTLQQEIIVHMRALATAQSSIVGKNITALNDAGWMASGFFIPDLVRLQDSYAEMVSHILPDVQEPAFIHRNVVQQSLSDSIALEPALRDLDHDVLDGAARFYANLAHTNAKMHDALVSGQTRDLGILPATGFDLRDQVTAATEPAAGFSLLAQAIDSAALSRGVWGNEPGVNDFGAILSITNSSVRYNPIALLIEFGRRQLDLGTYLLGLSGSVLNQPQLAFSAILGGLLGLVFIAGAIVLIFVVPLIPFIRFLLGILVWLLELAEALIAMPLVAIAHISFTGDGFSGSAARQAYLLWVALAVRPLFYVFGLAAGVLIFSFGLSLTFIAVAPVSQLASTSNGASLLIANVGLVIAYDIIAYVLANVAFKGITLFPDRALRWISSFVMTDAASHSLNSQLAPNASGGGGILAALAQHTTSSSSSSSDRQSTRTTAREQSNSGGKMTNLIPSYHRSSMSSVEPKGTSEKGALNNINSSTGASASSSAVSTSTSQALSLSDKTTPKRRDETFTDKPFFPAVSEARKRLEDQDDAKSEEKSPEDPEK